MKVRQHQYIDVLVVLVFVILCIQSVLVGNEILDYLSLVATSFMTVSIIIGLFLWSYVKVTKRRIFDPLDSELDDDPNDS